MTPVIDWDATIPLTLTPAVQGLSGGPPGSFDSVFLGTNMPDGTLVDRYEPGGVSWQYASFYVGSIIIPPVVAPGVDYGFSLAIAGETEIHTFQLAIGTDADLAALVNALAGESPWEPPGPSFYFQENPYQNYTPTSPAYRVGSEEGGWGSIADVGKLVMLYCLETFAVPVTDDDGSLVWTACGSEVAPEPTVTVTHAYEPSTGPSTGPTVAVGPVSGGPLRG